MTIEAVLARRCAEMDGRLITAEETLALKREIRPALLPPWFLNSLSLYPLVETTFSLPAELDESDLGVEMQWLSPSQTISETIEALPGIAAERLGYLPIGMCLVGSGDPYFLRITAGDDPPVVRIPHTAVNDDHSLQEDLVEEVSVRLSEFLAQAEIG